MKTNKQPKKSIKQKLLALRNKEPKHEYVLSDFTFRLKSSPAYKKDFKEVEVKFLYEGKTVYYYCFIRNLFNKKEILDLAKKQINSLIKSGEITSYAKKYCRKFYR